MSQPLLAGVELGGTKCLCVLGTASGALHRIEPVATTDPETTLAEIEAILDGWKVAGRAAALGVASFGPIELDPASPRYGFVTRTPKRGWADTDVAGRLARHFALPVGFDTDVTAAALAEGRWGGARGLASWTYVTVGTGVGGGVIVDGRPVRGLGHAEIGHMRVARLPGDDWPGACPFHGDCVEGLAAGFAIAARAGRPSEAIGADDPLWEGVAHALAGMLHNLALTAVPQRVLLGGGVILGQPHLLPRIRRALVASLTDYGAAGVITEQIEDYVAVTPLGETAGPLGAIALAGDAAVQAAVS